MPFCFSFFSSLPWLVLFNLWLRTPNNQCRFERISSHSKALLGGRIVHCVTFVAGPRDCMEICQGNAETITIVLYDAMHLGASTLLAGLFCNCWNCALDIDESICNQGKARVSNHFPNNLSSKKKHLSYPFENKISLCWAPMESA